jgi:hypothetical protein
MELVTERRYGIGNLQMHIKKETIKKHMLVILLDEKKNIKKPKKQK